MATIEVLVTPAAGKQVGSESPDPYRYGWRYVRRDREDGTYVMDQVPLTLEDVLHPQEGDQVTHSDAHQRRSRYLCDVFEARLADDPTAVVLEDVRVAWDIPGLKPHGPDIAVILGVRERKNWSTFDVAQEGVRPALIVEITSPETASIDRSIKLEEYDLAGVPLYVIVDTITLRRQPALRLLGYTLTPNGYQVQAANERGWLWLAPVRAWLGIAENEIVCYDEAGEPLGDYRALAAALLEEVQARVEAERPAAREVPARVEAERQAAIEAQARVEAERRAASAEARLQALEAEMRRLRSGEV